MRIANESPSYSVLTRSHEEQFVGSLIAVAKAPRVPQSANEADLFRFVAQLLKTRHPQEAKIMDDAAKSYFHQHQTTPRTFVQVLSDGLVTDVSRLRNLIEHGMEGASPWQK